MRERERERGRGKSRLWCNVSCLNGVDVDLTKGVTDSGIQALASAGCGAQLTSLTLKCE